KFDVSSSKFRLLTLLMRRVLPARAAILAELQSLRALPPVFRRAVVAPLALGARERDDVSHRQILRAYSIISVIVPAPTVRPPSRIAKRLPFSIATGTMSSAEIVVLSPGITIS